MPGQLSGPSAFSETKQKDCQMVFKKFDTTHGSRDVNQENLNEANHINEDINMTIKETK